MVMNKVADDPLLSYAVPVVNAYVDVAPLKQHDRQLQQLQLDNKNLEELVDERTGQVRRLTSEVLLTEQKVQQAVSQILHDELQQILVSLQMQTTTLYNALPDTDQPLLSQAQEIRDAVNLAFQVTRQVAADLALPFMQHQSFMGSLEFLTMLMEKRYGLQVKLKGSLRPDFPRQEVSNLLFQIVRELLFNVVKHAGVNQVVVEICEEDGRLRIEVSDNGQGFNVATVMSRVGQDNSLGLVNICNRLELYGGWFHLESQEGQGTRVTVLMPA